MATINILDASSNAQPMQTVYTGSANMAQVVISDTTATAVGTASNPLYTANAVYSYRHINTATTTTVKSGAGKLHTISVNTKGTASTTTVYDNTAGSGTVIAVIDSTNLLGSLTFDVQFATGLTIVTTGTPSITVSYL